VGHRRRDPWFDEAWRAASAEQFADLDAWLRQRIPANEADSISAWVKTLAGAAAPGENGRYPTRRRIVAYRNVVEGYGPPRVTASPPSG